MSASKKKIAKVMKQIKEDSEINPNSKWVEFKLNTNFIAPGVLMADEEERILLKLQKEGIIKLHIPETPGEEGRYSAYTPDEFMHETKLIWVEILDGFNKKYRYYRFYLGEINWWKIINPFWWLSLPFIVLIKIVKLIKKYLLISAITFLITLLGLLAIDYSLAWKNLKSIFNLIK
ncbi:MAG: hypothetical protein HQ538_00590 [Parcubacteria group bacterium]|nr:hypothetical protein [Parcubacteria group bacterium]